MNRLILISVATIATCFGSVLAQSDVSPGNDLPSPFQAAVRNFGTLPDGRIWGSTSRRRTEIHRLRC